MPDSLHTENLVASLYALIERAAYELPSDVVSALRRGRDAEDEGSAAEWALNTILNNIEMAKENRTPVCQDSGTMLFEFFVPEGTVRSHVEMCCRAAIADATRSGALRQNTIDPVSGGSSPLNEGAGVPVLYIRETPSARIRVRLMMKGGGCENVSTQFALPDESIAADRSLDGVFRCCLEGLVRAQGKGCSPGVLGICVGGDRATGYACAKAQCFRLLTDSSPVPGLAELETRVLDASRSLGVGPMGLGGVTTLLGVKAAAVARLPASYFVSLSYMCWALRRQAAELDEEQKIVDWLETDW